MIPDGVVRTAAQDDVLALVALEALCWPPPLRSSGDRIARRIAHHPDGQLVMTISDEIVGAIYTQRIVRSEDLDGLTAEGFDRLHDPSGSVAQLLGVCVRPDRGERGIGEALVQRVLQSLGEDPTVARIVGVTLCRDFLSSGSADIASHVFRCDAFGLPADPILRFHVGRGARILKILPGVHPGYAAGGEAGVLIEYDKDVAAASADPADAAPPGDPLVVSASVEAAIRAVLGPARATGFDLDRSLGSMGLDSLDLHGLSALINRSLGTHIDATFFFRHPTARRILAALTRPATEAESETPTENDASEERTIRAKVALEGQVAIVGMACRFPGGANSPELFWRLLNEGRDAITDPPADRDNAKALRRGGFLDQVDRFDAAFFGISPREAAAMDPQQRLMLEVSWEALERAGIAPDRLEGTDTAVFIGLFGHDYERLAQPDGYYGTGNAGSIVSGRIAYTLGLSGPALSIDTACSAGLVAVHTAARSLLAGECHLAIAGAVNLILSPELDIAFGHAGMLAADGRCKAFASNADGYVRSEGCAAVVLKRLDDALADGDPILAVIEGTAVNHDGRSNGLTAPSGSAQSAVIRKALAAAQISPAEVGYVEAHGTGTALGDPIEFAALSDAYGEGREGQPLIVGSVKSNIGHTEAAAGLAGLIKAVLVLQHGRVPRQLHLSAVNPLIDLGAVPARLPLAAIEWPARDAATRRAGVSSFGFSGTNAHAILAEAPTRPARTNDGEPHLLVLSARSGEALAGLAEDFERHLAGTAAAAGDIAYSAACGRRPERHRLAIVGETTAEWARELKRWRTGHALATAVAGEARNAPNVAFLFTGQGSQYPGMAAQLYRSHAGVRRTLEECADLFAPLLERPLLDVLKPDSPDARLLERMSYAQPALFAVEMALARMWMDAGIQPVAVIGHSLGEIAAACVAGVLSLADAARLVAHRGRLMEEMPRGAMAVVFAEVNLVAAHLTPDGPTIAGYNGPSNTVISGTVEAVEQALSACESAGMDVHRLDVTRAAHSRHMEPMLASFAEVCRTLSLCRPAIPIVSNVTGRLVEHELADPDYWVRHVRSPVRFADGIAALASLGIDAFLEVGPKPVLIGLAQECLPAGSDRVFLPSLTPLEPDRQTVLQSAGRLFANGASIDWRRLDGGRKRMSVALPTTRFERQRHWHSFVDARPAAPSSRALHGARLDLAVGETVFTSSIGAGHRREFLDHRVDGQVVLPAAAAIEMMAGAFAEASGASSVRLSRIAFHRPLVLPETGAIEVQTVLKAPAVRLAARTADGAWTTHVEATAALLEQGVPNELRLNGMFDAALAALPAGGKPMPLEIEHVDLHMSGRADLDLRCSAKLRDDRPDGRTFIVDVAACDAAGTPIAAIQGLTFCEPADSAFYHWQWIDMSGESPAGAPDDLALALEQRAQSLARAALDGLDPRDVAPGQQKLFDHLSGILTRETGLARRIETAPDVLDLLEYCGAELGNVLRGRRDPLDLLVPGGDFGPLERFYSESQVFAPAQRAIAEAVARTGPRGRRLRILEIGAGTGATTAAVLAQLQGRPVDYVYTDISPAFLAHAREKFVGTPLEFRLLDIENDPIGQGFAAGTFDIVIAANVLHATRNLAASLQHAADLLKPDGALVLLEGVARRLWIDVIFGQLPGWWLFDGDELRRDHPLLDGASWAKVLADGGFAVGAIAADENAPFPQTVIVARQAASPWLILGEEPADALARWLRLRGQPCRVTRDIHGVETQGATIVDLRFLHETSIDRNGPLLLSLLQQANAASLALVMAGAMARPDAGVLSGLAQVARRERGGFSTTVIDCDTTPDWRAMAEILLDGHREDRIMLRRRRRQVARLRRYRPAAAQRPILRGTQLITGGLGAIGRHVAGWLVDHGATSLALVGRSAPGPAQQAWLEQMRSRGCAVTYRQADIGRREQCAAVLDAFAAEAPPIAGLWHAAGTHDDGLLDDQSWPRIQAVLAGKLLGALHLHELTANLALDHFVLFSSAFGLMGAPGLAGYVAANAGLDALAEARRAAGLPAMVIDWGPWADTGMVRAGAKASQPEWTRQGLRPMAVDRCLAALDAALGEGAAQLVVVDADWERFGAAFGGEPPAAISELLPVGGTATMPIASTPRTESPGTDVASRLRALPPRRRQAALADHLATLVAAALGHDGAAQVDRSQGFFAQGLDSLSTLDLRNRIQATLGWQLEQRLLFRHSSVDSLAAFLASEFLVAERAA